LFERKIDTNNEERINKINRDEFISENNNNKIAMELDVVVNIYS
jgi:hypothetical protein